MFRPLVRPNGSHRSVQLGARSAISTTMYSCKPSRAFKPVAPYDSSAVYNPKCTLPVCMAHQDLARRSHCWNFSPVAVAESSHPFCFAHSFLAECLWLPSLAFSARQTRWLLHPDSYDAPATAEGPAGGQTRSSGAAPVSVPSFASIAKQMRCPDELANKESPPVHEGM